MRSDRQDDDGGNNENQKSGVGNMRVTLLVLFSSICFVPLADAWQENESVQTETPVTVQPVSRLEEDWWAERHEEKLQAKQQMESVDLVLIGDSITHSWETTGQQVWKKSFPDVATLNLGFSGDRTEHVLWRFANGQIDDIEPKAVMLLIGTNNTGHHLHDPADIAAGIKAIIEDLNTRLPNTQILLLAVFPYDQDPQSPRRKNNEAVNVLIAELHDGERVHYLDICEKFFDEDGEMTKEITPDFLHLSPAGYQIWADAVKPRLMELLEE
ncbi:MAG: GDSL-type esterase/lipase family protein [Pirellulaceae bacterium]